MFFHQTITMLIYYFFFTIFIIYMTSQTFTGTNSEFEYCYANYNFKKPQHASSKAHLLFKI